MLKKFLKKQTVTDRLLTRLFNGNNLVLKGQGNGETLKVNTSLTEIYLNSNKIGD